MSVLKYEEMRVNECVGCSEVRYFLKRGKMLAMYLKESLEREQVLAAQQVSKYCQ